MRPVSQITLRAMYRLTCVHVHRVRIGAHPGVGSLSHVMSAVGHSTCCIRTHCLYRVCTLPIGPLAPISPNVSGPSHASRTCPNVCHSHLRTSRTTRSSKVWWRHPLSPERLWLVVRFHRSRSMVRPPARNSACLHAIHTLVSCVLILKASAQVPLSDDVYG